MFVWAYNTMVVMLTSDFNIFLLGFCRRKRKLSLITKIALRKETRTSRKAKRKFAMGSIEVRETYAYRSPSLGSARLNTAPCTHHPGEHSHPCIAGSLFEEAHYRHCNSNHILERKSTLDQLSFSLSLVPAIHLGGHSL